MHDWLASPGAKLALLLMHGQPTCPFCPSSLLACRNLEKADAEKTVNAVWQGKAEFERTHNISVTLPDYLYIFLHRKFSTPKSLSEAAYNLLYNLSKHTYDPDCSIFLKVLWSQM